MDTARFDGRRRIMAFGSFAEYLRRRRHRREYRRSVAEFYAAGGDAALRFDYDLAPGSLVIDLGGYEGQWASDLYARQRCRIVVFEPVKSFADAIAARFRRNPDVEVLPFALGATTREEELSVCGASSSAFKAKAQRERVRFVDVAEWFDERGIDDVALMKVNIEGGEYELLERMLERGLVSRVRDLQVQFHNFTADASERMAAIQRNLALTHDPTYRFRFVWENWRRRAGRGAA
jgi:FkbM family methyltransferase